MRVLIAGSGYVGNRLAEALASDGCEVYALRRSEPRAVPDGVTPIVADLTKLDTLGALPAKIDSVVFTAGAGAPDEAAYRATYIDGMGTLIRALQELGERPRRVVFCSSTSVYAQRRGEWIDEDSPAHPMRYQGDSMLAAERLLFASDLPSVSIRFGGIYGPGRTRLVQRVQKGEARLRSDVHFTNRIHRDDCVGALSHLLRIDDPEPLYLGVDSHPADEAELLCFLAAKLGLPEPERMAVSGASSGLRAGSKRCSNKRLLATGYRFQYPSYREGYGALVREVLARKH